MTWWNPWRHREEGRGCRVEGNGDRARLVAECVASPWILAQDGSGWLKSHENTETRAVGMGPAEPIVSLMFSSGL